VATHLAAGTSSSPAIVEGAGDGSVIVGLAEETPETPIVEHLASVDTLLLLAADGIRPVDVADLSTLEVERPLDPLTPISIVVGSFPTSGAVLADVTVAHRWRTDGLVLTSALQLGLASAAVDLATAYAMEREQFGRPIGSFQAVKHMLADMYVSATLARSNSYYGAWALSTNAAELPEAAAAARISATQAFQHCAKNNIQVHGGMGFTWEFDCHMYYRRANAVALALGSLSYWEDALIDRMRKRNAA
jgi:alkylation response protein AidB-like acyl-CoA dehydrogenase